VVRVTDGVGCFGFYIDNPVLLEDIPGPQVVEVNVTDETDFLGNGINRNHCQVEVHTGDLLFDWMAERLINRTMTEPLTIWDLGFIIY
jgi:hypothetical protein